MKKFTSYLTFAFLVLMLAGCGDKKTIDFSEKTSPGIGKVNGQTITAEDLRIELEGRKMKDPEYKSDATFSKEVDAIVTRKIMLQIAIDKKYDREESFLTTVKLFWEQTLLRRLMDELSAEFVKSVSATDDEAKKFYQEIVDKNPANKLEYEKVSDNVKKQLLFQKKRKEFDRWIEEKKKSAQISVDVEAFKKHLEKKS